MLEVELFSLACVPTNVHNDDHFACGNMKQNFIYHEVLSFEICNLSQINTFPIEKFISLKELSIRNNNIQQIADKLFNQDRINKTTFFGLNELEHLLLSRNNITIIHLNAFNDRLNLYQLDLDSNLFKQIEPGTFSILKNLGNLNLSKNQLQAIDFDVILPMQKTFGTLFINENQLTEINIPTYFDLPKLWWFN